MKQWQAISLMVGIFLAAYFTPFAHPIVRQSGLEAFMMLQEYAREHVLLCLVPAFFIAGAIAVFISQASVIKYFGGQAQKWLAYSVASVSGGILAVCSCTILPLFAGIYARGAGIGPATAFLYAGPAINVLAIILTARVLGIELGVARAVGAIGFSIVIGLLMHLAFLKEEREKAKEAAAVLLPEEENGKPLWKMIIYFALMVGILVFANWGKPGDAKITLNNGTVLEGVLSGETLTEYHFKKIDGNAIQVIPKDNIFSIDYAPSFYTSIYKARFYIAGALLLGLIGALSLWFKPAELREWGASTWNYAGMILPLLFLGVLAAGFLLGRPGHTALIPERWIATSVGGNSWFSNAFASVAGAFMYFATLTEVPILQGLLGAGMGKGPALALLLAGPALSLPSMLVIRQVMGTKKTILFITLVCVMATVAGKVFGTFWG
ncbi:MAG: permease [Thermodesulfobacteriota bacterium]|nr:permease [Thermodesulfobacteriota bacterium]